MDVPRHAALLWLALHAVPKFLTPFPLTCTLPRARRLSITMLSAVSAALAFNAGPVAVPATRASGVSMTAIRPGDIGTTKPLGVYDPLNLMTKMPNKYRRWQEMEIKHGRFAMAGFVHIVLTEAGVRWPGYLSFAEDIKFSDMPGGALASWSALPALSWIQIILVVALLDNSVLAQDPSKPAGDVGDGTFVQPGKIWVRYNDQPGFTGKEFKLNAERNNGRAAMMGVTGAPRAGGERVEREGGQTLARCLPSQPPRAHTTYHTPL